MRRLLALLLVGSAALLAVPPLVGVAAGDAPDATGWWARTRHGNALLPVEGPPLVPDGGLYVAGDPTGPSGVSALRAAVGDVVDLVLVLEVESAQGTVAVRACPTEVVWPDEQGGPLAAAPTGDCDVAVNAVAEEGELRMGVGPLVRDGVLNIVLDPEPGAVFQATFVAPGDGALVTGTAGAGSPPDEPSFVPDAAPPPTGSTGPAATDVGFPSPELPELPEVEVPTASADGSSGETASAPPTRVASAVAPSAESNRPRVIAALVLFDLLLVVLWLLRWPAPIWAGLGFPVDRSEEVVGGVGRFARVRSGPVPRL